MRSIFLLLYPLDQRILNPPGSKNKEIQPASPVNVFGRIAYDTKRLKLVHFGEKIRLDWE
jgi:hypothetical protein